MQIGQHSVSVSVSNMACLGINAWIISYCLGNRSERQCKILPVVMLKGENTTEINGCSLSPSFLQYMYIALQYLRLPQLTSI